MQVAKDNAAAVMTTVTETFFKDEFLQLFRKVNPNAAKVISSFGPVLQGIAAILKTMTPTDEMMKTVQKADSIWKGDKKMAKMMDRMTTHMENMEKPIKGIVKAVGGSMSTIMKSVGDVIQKVGHMQVAPEAMTAVADILGSVMGALGNMMQGIGPSVQAAEKISSKFSNAGQSFRANLKAIGKMAGAMAEAFADSMPSITTMIKEMVKVAKGIGDPKGIADRVKVIVDLMGVLGDISDIFGGKNSELSNYGKRNKAGEIETPLKAMHHNMKSFSNCNAFVIVGHNTISSISKRHLGLLVNS